MGAVVPVLVPLEVAALSNSAHEAASLEALAAALAVELKVGLSEVEAVTQLHTIQEELMSGHK